VRIFAYEHITGGGLLDQHGLAALAPEGELMLRSLMQDLLAIPGVEVTVMRDPRLTFDCRLQPACRIPRANLVGIQTRCARGRCSVADRA
jgi:hypothetical protein